MTLHDPSITRPGRVAFAGVICVAALAAAGLAGWGWWSSLGHAADVAVSIGQPGSIVLLAVTGLALPPRWQASSVAAPLLLGLAGFQLLAASVGMCIARASSHASGRGVLMIVGLALVLLGSAALVRIRSLSRAATHDRAGAHVAGLVTAMGQTGVVDNVPHWRVVVRFSDASGTTRWVTNHSTTWSPPSVGQQVNVYFDPSRPDHKQDIFVSW